MSRNARIFAPRRLRGHHWHQVGALTLLLGGSCAAAQSPASLLPESPARSRVVVVYDAEATQAFKPQAEHIREMISRGLTHLTGKPAVTDAWLSLVSTKDIVGIKVFSSPGADAGTRPAVVAAVVEGLLQAKVPATNIIIWDKHLADLRQAGFAELAARYGVRLEGSLQAGFDENTYYSPERPILGQLIWSDLEFSRKGDGVGRRSYVSTLLASNLTRIISVTPLLNHNSAGVTGHLYSLAMGSVDNTGRFERDLFRLTDAIPEIYALPAVGDRVVLSITDALICQYQGEQRSLLHYSTVLNELRFSKDPVALDFLSLRELERTRAASDTSLPKQYSFTNQLELLRNASLLELGASDAENIKIERLR